MLKPQGHPDLRNSVLLERVPMSGSKLPVNEDSLYRVGKKQRAQASQTASLIARELLHPHPSRRQRDLYDAVVKADRIHRIRMEAQ